MREIWSNRMWLHPCCCCCCSVTHSCLTLCNPTDCLMPLCSYMRELITKKAWQLWSQTRNGLRDSLMTMVICITNFDPRCLLSNYLKKKKKKGAKRKLRHNIWALLENSQHETLIVIKTGRLCSLWKLFSREDPKGVTFPTVILSRFQFPTVFPTHLINLKLTPRNPVSQPLHPIITWPSQWKILHILQENEY